MYSDSAEYRDCQKTRWNPQATSFMFKDFGFPVVALTNETEVDVLIGQVSKKKLHVWYPVWNLSDYKCKT